MDRLLKGKESENTRIRRKRRLEINWEMKIYSTVQKEEEKNSSSIFLTSLFSQRFYRPFISRVVHLDGLSLLVTILCVRD